MVAWRTRTAAWVRDAPLRMIDRPAQNSTKLTTPSPFLSNALKSSPRKFPASAGTSTLFSALPNCSSVITVLPASGESAATAINADCIFFSSSLLKCTDLAICPRANSFVPVKGLPSADNEAPMLARETTR